MRVIAGRWKGRKLRAGAGQAVRPTTDRVKEALFSLLGPEIPGAVVMDLCCGSGGLGIPIDPLVHLGCHAVSY